MPLRSGFPSEEELPEVAPTSVGPRRVGGQGQQGALAEPSSRCEATPKGGKWESPNTWTNGRVPTKYDIVYLTAASGNVTGEAGCECQSIEASTYTKTLSLSVGNFLIGGPYGNGTAMNIGASAVFKLGVNGGLKFVSTSGVVETITISPPLIENAQFVGNVFFESETGKWLLESPIKTTNFTEIVKGELSLGAGCTNLYMGSLRIKVGGTMRFGSCVVQSGFRGLGGVCYENAGTIFGESSTLELLIGASPLNSPGEARMGGATYNNVVFLTGNITVKDSWTAANITFSKAAGWTGGIKVEEGVTITFTGSITPNSSPSQKLKLESTVAGKAWKLKCASQVVLKYIELKDCTAEGGTPFLAEASINNGGNTNWTFTVEAVPAAPPLQPPQLYSPARVGEPFPLSEPEKPTTRTDERALEVTQGQSASLTREVTRALSATQGQSAALSKALARTLTATQGSSATKQAELSRTLTATQGQSATRTAIPTRVLTVSQGSSATKSVAISRTLSATQVASSAIEKALARTLTVTQPSSASESASTGKSLSVGQGSSATKSVAISRTLSASQSQAVTRTVALGRTLSATQAQAIVRIVALTRTLVATQGQSATQSATPGKVLTAGQGSAAVKSAAIARTLSAGQGQGASKQAALSRTLTAGQGQEALVILAHVRYTELSATQGQGVTLTFSVGRTLRASQSATATLARSLARTLTRSQPQTVHLARSPSRSLTAAQGSQVTMVRGIGKPVPAMQGSQAELQVGVARTLTVGQGQSISLTAQVISNFAPGQLASVVRWAGMSSNTTTGIVSSSSSSAILTSSVEDTNESSVEPKLRPESSVS